MTEEKYRELLRAARQAAMEERGAEVRMCAALGEGVRAQEGGEYDKTRLMEVCATADEVRRERCPGGIDTCSIVNGRSGRCSEDCHWCSQAGAHHTGCREYLFVDEGEFVEELCRNAARGVRRISIVCSGRKVGLGDVKRFCEMYRRGVAAARAQGHDIELCASMGLIGRAEMEELRKAGVSRYHCNLETASGVFPRLCSTHTQADKLRTIAIAHAVGMEVCSGGIIGMGESLEERLEMAREVRDAGAVSMPVNLLNPIAGTPLEGTPLLGEAEVILTCALMRLVAPAMAIRFAGGRARLSREATQQMLKGGVNGVMVGDMLTTAGNDMAGDLEMLREIDSGAGEKK